MFNQKNKIKINIIEFFIPFEEFFPKRRKIRSQFVKNKKAIFGGGFVIPRCEIDDFDCVRFMDARDALANKARSSAGEIGWCCGVRILGARRNTNGVESKKCTTGRDKAEQPQIKNPKRLGEAKPKKIKNASRRAGTKSTIPNQKCTMGVRRSQMTLNQKYG